MKPKEILNSYIEDYLVDELEKLGFRYSKSVTKFSRTKGEFDLTFSFSLSKWNSEDNCEFWTMWSISSNRFSKWYKKQWDSKPANNTIVGKAEWNIPGWTRNASNHFILTNTPDDENQLNELTRNIKTIGIPFFEKINDWSIAAEYATQSEVLLYDKVCDFYLLVGELEKAKEILEIGIKEIEQRGNDQLMLLPQINKRLDKYFLSV